MSDKIEYEIIEQKFFSPKVWFRRGFLLAWSITLLATVVSITGMVVTTHDSKVNFGTSLFACILVSMTIIPLLASFSFADTSMDIAIRNVKLKYNTANLSIGGLQGNALGAMYYDKDSGVRSPIEFAFMPNTNEPFLLKGNRVRNIVEIERNISK